MVEDYSRIKKKVNFLGIEINVLSLEHLLQTINNSLFISRKLNISFVNPYSINMTFKNHHFRTLLNSFDVICADGIGVIWASKLLRISIPQRISADIISPSIFGIAECNDYHIFLLGSKDGVALKAANNITNNFPNLKIVGVHHGYFQEKENYKVVTKINNAKTDILLVGLGAPLQEEWIIKNDQELRPIIRMTCGGYFHQIAERFPYYPPIIHRLTLNWIYRMFKEPRRLWKRYLLGNQLFLYRVLKQKLQC